MVPAEKSSWKLAILPGVPGSQGVAEAEACQQLYANVTAQAQVGVTTCATCGKVWTLEKCPIDRLLRNHIVLSQLHKKNHLSSVYTLYLAFPMLKFEISKYLHSIFNRTFPFVLSHYVLFYKPNQRIALILQIYAWIWNLNAEWKKNFF